MEIVRLGWARGTLGTKAKSPQTREGSTRNPRTNKFFFFFGMLISILLVVTCAPVPFE